MVTRDHKNEKEKVWPIEIENDPVCESNNNKKIISLESIDIQSAIGKSENEKRLTQVAEELVKVAYEQTEAAGIDNQRNISKNIIDLIEEIIIMNSDMKNEFNTVNQNLKDI